MTRNMDVLEKQTNGATESTTAVPAADIFETPEAYLIVLDIPGASKDTLRVTLEKDELTVTAGIAARRAENGTVLYSELRATGYERSFNLGYDIDRNRVDAKFDQGVLSVTLYKKPETQTKQITIR